MNKKLVITVLVAVLIVVVFIVAYQNRGAIFQGKVPTQEKLDFLPSVSAEKTGKKELTVSAKVMNNSIVKHGKGKPLTVKFFVNGVAIPELTRTLRGEFRPGMEVEFPVSVSEEYLKEIGADVSASGEYKISVEVETPEEEHASEKENNKAEVTIKK